ncbi:uncharacterized protein LOC110710412 [Chenopodium quinoa]|uniref:uncharacterized protein LOC110710412 n=1 Tax=Chenopodium quinoa TaxID=63459 RepID=UPI000B793D9C|nr:uncharacterized protein LOC110710412 [Chenopodium quinoa]
MQNWSISTNFHLHKGGRILVAWLDSNFIVDILYVSAQCVHLYVKNVAMKRDFTITVVYAFNDNESRKPLWNDLCDLHRSVKGPWIVTGDFNSPLYLEDRIGREVSPAEIRDFQHATINCEVVDMSSIGPRFTWNNKQYGSKRVLSKLDRCLVNADWVRDFPSAYAHFHPEGAFDHCPVVVHLDNQRIEGKAGFKFLDYWADHPLFYRTVENGWSSDIRGVPMYKVVKKMKQIKNGLKSLQKRYFDQIEEQFMQVNAELNSIQEVMHNFPADPMVSQYEYEVAQRYTITKKAYVSYLAQRAKAHWLKAGDENTQYFHKGLLEHRELLCSKRLLTDKEIKQAMFSIPGTKAPGPDGYNSTFFTKSWHIVGLEVCEAIRDFFEHGKMLKEVNCTRLTVIPKAEVSPSWSNFSYSISFHSRKAYDFVQWDFLKEMLESLHFPDQFISWIMACVTTPSFTLFVNGQNHGFFKGKQGLRQGDPMSPLLFVICMEYLSRLLHYAGNQEGYKFHYRCSSLKLNHLVFADDLILFFRGEKYSVMLNMRALTTFAQASGLVANNGKSALYTCNMNEEVKEEILRCTGFVEESLPFRYLGVRINAKKMSANDCDFMVDKIVARIKSWGARHLSYASRAQLVNTVLLNLHSYWASMFFLPKKVIDQVTTMCRNFLWSGEPFSTKSPPIAWDLVCRPKREGGLGFKESHTWNIAMLGKYVWSIASKEDNMWVKWVNHVYLRGRDWKSYSVPPSASWYWK